MPSCRFKMPSGRLLIGALKSAGRRMPSLRPAICSRRPLLNFRSHRERSRFRKLNYCDSTRESNPLCGWPLRAASFRHHSGAATASAIAPLIGPRSMGVAAIRQAAGLLIGAVRLRLAIVWPASTYDPRTRCSGESAKPVLTPNVQGAADHLVDLVPATMVQP